MRRLGRREFNRLLLAGCGAALAGCGSDGDPADSSTDYTEEDAARLDRQIAEEAARAGHGRFGPLRFRGYRGLADLPWFELGPDGRLRLAADLPGIVDVHTHFGMDFYRHLDPTRRTERVEHWLDCDGRDPGCELDLDVYANANFSAAERAALPRRLVAGAFGLGAGRTHTAANLLAEMDDVGVAKAVVLPIAMSLPFAGGLPARWLRSIQANGWQDRLVPFTSVDPNDAEAPAKLAALADAGARGVKLHPEMQRFFPDGDGAMAVYEVCRERGLVVLFHGGRSGIEPEAVRKYALMRRYEPAAADFPDVRFVFGHGGARDLERAIPIARAHRNVWLGLSCLGASQLATALAALGPDRLMNGSDWPFYHLALSLAKILIVTRDDPGARDALLRDNALALLG